VDDNRSFAVIRAAVLVVLFGALTWQVHERGWLTGADEPVREWFVAHRTPVWTTVALAGKFGSPDCVIALTCLIAAVALLRRRSLRTAITLLAIVSLTEAAVTLAKLAVSRPRPPLATQLEHATGFSYPSGHTAGTTAFVGALLLVYAPSSLRASRRMFRYIVGAFVVVGVAISRIYLGVHWLSDVAGGVLLGSAVVLVVAVVSARPLSRMHTTDTTSAAGRVVGHPTVAANTSEPYALT
jgi:undecaprenyl-diphosphatase